MPLGRINLQHWMPVNKVKMGAEPIEGGRVALPSPVPKAAPIAIDPGMWFSMVNIKTPQLADLEIESMKKIVSDYKRYAQKCPAQAGQYLEVCINSLWRTIWKLLSKILKRLDSK
jgi:hypothetical protein